MLRFTRALSFIVFLLTALPISASACLCSSSVRESTTSHEMAKGHHALIGVAIKSEVIDGETDPHVTTTFKVLDPLGGHFSKEVEVQNIAPSTSCGIRTKVGDLVPLLLHESDSGLTMPACPMALVQVVADVQMTGKNYAIDGYRDCMIRLKDKSKSSGFLETASCRFHRENSYETITPESKYLLDRYKSAASKWQSEKSNLPRLPLFSDGTAPPPNENTSSDAEAYKMSSDLAFEFDVFEGYKMKSELGDDGKALVTYVVLNDYGQYLPDLIQSHEVPTDLSNVGVRSVFMTTRHKPRQTVFSTVKQIAIPLAYADWRQNGVDHEIPKEVCFVDCDDDDFDFREIRRKLLQSEPSLSYSDALLRMNQQVVSIATGEE